MRRLIASLHLWLLCTLAAGAEGLRFSLEIHSEDLVDVKVFSGPKKDRGSATLVSETKEVKLFQCRVPGAEFGSEEDSNDDLAVSVEVTHAIPGGGQHYRQVFEYKGSNLTGPALCLKGHAGRILFGELTDEIGTIHFKLLGGNGVSVIGSSERIQLSQLIANCEIPAGEYQLAVSLDGEKWSRLEHPLVVAKTGGYQLDEGKFSIGERKLNPRVECQVLSFPLSIDSSKPLLTSLRYPDGTYSFGDALRIAVTGGIFHYKCKLYAGKPMSPDKLDGSSVTIWPKDDEDFCDPLGMGEIYQYVTPRNGKVKDLEIKLFQGLLTVHFPSEENANILYTIRNESGNYATQPAHRVSADDRMIRWNLPAGSYQLSVFDPGKAKSSSEWNLVIGEGGKSIQVTKKEPAEL